MVDTTSSYHVRLARPDNREAIFDICHHYHSEMGLFSLNENKVHQIVDMALLGFGPVIGIIGDKEIEGTVCLRVSNPPYSDDFMLEEVWNFVPPAYRQSTRGKYLIRFGKTCADKLNLPLYVSAAQNAQTEAKCKLYDRELPVAGKFYLYHPNPAKLQVAA